MGQGEFSLKRLLIAAVLAGILINTASAQITKPACGTEGQRACRIVDAEFWANNRDCDWGLKNSTDHIAFFFGADGTCMNDKRSTISDKSWVAWALDEQLLRIQADLPANRATFLGTHDSFSNYADGDNNAWATSQYYSITDQLNMGARYLRVDPIYYFDQLRTCHTSPVSSDASTPVVGPVLGNATILSEADNCRAQALWPFLGLAAMFGEIALPIHLAPPPVPELVDFVLIGASVYGATQPINSRLFSYTVQEISKWLNDHPGELILLDIRQSGSPHDQVKEILTNYLADKIYSNADFQNDHHWPGIGTLIARGKQVILFSDYASDSYAFPRSQGSGFANGMLKKADGTTDNLDTCTTDNAVVSDIHRAYPDLWVQIGEGRTGSNAGDPVSSLLYEPEITKAVACGFNMINVDFLGALDKAFPGRNRTDPDKRREAAIWTFAQDDYGKLGPAVMIGSTGGWTSMNAVNNQLPFACASAPDVNGVRTWNVTTGVSDIYNEDRGKMACQSIGVDYTFAHPNTAAENAKLQAVLAQNKIDRAWLKYAAIKLPPAFVIPGKVDLYVDRGSSPADPEPLRISGSAGAKLPASITYTEGGAWLSIQRFQNVQLSDTGFGDLGFDIDPSVIQNLSHGVYQSIVTLDAGTAQIQIPITLHVLEPTKIDTFTATPAGLLPLSDNVILKAHVATRLRKPENAESGGSISITGGVTFTDLTAGSDGQATFVKLGTIPINNYADRASDNNNGRLHAILDNCPDDWVCASTYLPFGIPHSVTAVYSRDNTYNSSSSAPQYVLLGSYASPGSLSFQMTNAGPQIAPAQQVFLKSISWLDSQVIVDAPWIKTTLQMTGGTSIVRDLTITVNVDASRLKPGVYHGTITVPVEEIKIPVTLTILDRDFRVNQKSLQLVSKEQKATPRSFGVSGAGPFTMSATTSSGGNWLKLASSTGTAPADIEVSVNANGLPAGTYNGAITIVSPVLAAPITISVTLTAYLSGPAFNIQTNVPGAQVSMDGVPYPMPAAFLWKPGSSHQISIPNRYQYPASGTRVAFDSWNFGSAPKITDNSVTISNWSTSNNQATANLAADYRLETSVAPSNAGTITPSRWCPASGYVDVVVQPAAGFTFLNQTWTYDGRTFDLPNYSYTTQLGHPLTVTAKFK